MQGNSALAGASGATVGEFIAQQMYPGVKRADLTEEQKQTISSLSTLAAGLAGGLTGDSSANAVAGAQAGKNAVENNALYSGDEKQRQDAKWSLPYLEGEKKAQAEKLVTDLDAKDKAFDMALDKACQGLSSAACQGMRQELAAMGKSYDEQLDGQYVGTMASVYKEGADKVDGLLWHYATADAQAQKAKDIQTIASNWGVSIETASVLYTGMAITHTTAAIGGAVYGMKGIKEPSNPLSQGSNQLINSKWFDAEGLPLPVPPSVGAAGRVPNVLQSGGNTLNKSTANALNENLGESMTSREWGRALEALKKDNGLRNDFHGRILDNGNCVDKSGNIIGNIGDYVP